MLRTITLSEIIKESPTSCCSLMSRRCAAQDRCDAASGWVDFCAITIKRRRESPRYVGRGECCAWASMLSYMLFVTIIDGKLMSRGGCRRPALAQSPPRFLSSFRFFDPTGEPNREGGSLRDVQQLAGHSSLATTQRYIEGSSDAKRRIVDLIS